MLRWSDEELKAYQAARQGRAAAKAEAKQHVADTPRAKYRNKKTAVDGQVFDSKAEAARYVQLKQLEEGGVITNLKCQVPYELAPAVRFSGKRKTPPLRYFADFVYEKDSTIIVEDVKSKATLTQSFKIKKHLMLSVLGIEIKVFS